MLALSQPPWKTRIQPETIPVAHGFGVPVWLLHIVILGLITLNPNSLRGT